MRYLRPDFTQKLPKTAERIALGEMYITYNLIIFYNIYFKNKSQKSLKTQNVCKVSMIYIYL